MKIILLLGSGLAGSAFALINARILAKAIIPKLFCSMCAFVVLLLFFLFFLRQEKITALSGLVILKDSCLVMIHLYSGYFVATSLKAILALDGSVAPPVHAAASSGLAVLAAGNFLLFSAGKALHPADMELFFTSSGLPFWFHYVVMALEICGAVGLLADKWLHTGPPAAVGLLLIMIGAIAVHSRNGDPLSDSYDAIVQLIYLLILLLAFLARKKTGRPA
ncbi:hypothetical protein C7T94_18285 [Pedobacter yulinensis]|uniref:DoxX family protein n=1 Tax=Pedobacter yulinensis TaxID=2126353 RepID=A0A2T3HHA3_9SPHI|nr:DoxX family protein [Pedobacter yulinensis]PST81817.1 hypothetical protein C7T94_18285 [Pedobacter yulinensis]